MTRWKTTLSACMTLAICGCSGTRTRFYTLQPASRTAAPMTYVGAPFRVDAVHIPSSLDRPELVQEVASNHVVVRDNEHWAGPLEDLFRRALTQDLAALLGPESVIYPNTPKQAGAGGLVVDILAVSPAGADLAMDVSWSLFPSNGASPSGARLAVRHGTLRVSTPGLGAGPAAYAAELGQLTDKLASAIATELSSTR
jgi:uncharacterized lipoprotein YmbA